MTNNIGQRKIPTTKVSRGAVVTKAILKIGMSSGKVVIDGWI